MNQLEYFTYDSAQPGPKLLILGAVHGNEPAGTLAIKKIMAQLDSKEVELKSGSITFLPVCNPVAKEKEVRFVEYNLNRILKRHDSIDSIEKSYANQICDLIDQADYVLDIHSTHLEGDLPTVFNDFVDEQTSAWANSLNIGTVITSWRDMLNNSEAKDDFSDTVYYPYQQGKKALLVEAGYHYEPNAENLAYQAIVNTLEFFEITDKTQQKSVDNNVAHMYKVVFKTEEQGSLVQDWKHMDEVKANDIVAKLDNGTELKAEFDGYVVIPFPEATAGEEWFYLAKK